MMTEIVINTTNTNTNTTTNRTANPTTNNTTNNSIINTNTVINDTLTSTPKVCTDYFTDFNTAIDDRNNIVEIKSVEQFAPQLLTNSSLILQDEEITNV